MNSDLAISIFRTALQMIGAGLAARGIGTESDWEAISGGVIALGAVGWMVAARWRNPAP